jgi:hypothetical protein
MGLGGARHDHDRQRFMARRKPGVWPSWHTAWRALGYDVAYSGAIFLVSLVLALVVIAVVMAAWTLLPLVLR